jgi:hypothetical protein
MGPDKLRTGIDPRIPPAVDQMGKAELAYRDAIRSLKLDQIVAALRGCSVSADHLESIGLHDRAKHMRKLGKALTKRGALIEKHGPDAIAAKDKALRDAPETRPPR